jgi:hypothetical protein
MREPIERLMEIEQPFGVAICVSGAPVECDWPNTAAAFERDALACSVHEHMTHRDSRESEEMDAIRPVRAGLVDELEVGLVKKRRRLQRRASPASNEMAMRDLAQLLV